MNKIYKVIWNKAKNCYVVTSELAKSHGKGNGRARSDAYNKEIGAVDVARIFSAAACACPAITR